MNINFIQKSQFWQGTLSLKECFFYTLYFFICWKYSSTISKQTDRYFRWKIMNFKTQNITAQHSEKRIHLWSPSRVSVFLRRFVKNLSKNVIISWEIRKKRPHLKKKNIFFDDDNAPSHTSSIAQAKKHELDFKSLPHPLYSPDLPPTEYYLFRSLKRWLGGRCFESTVKLNRKQKGIL